MSCHCRLAGALSPVECSFATPFPAYIDAVRTPSQWPEGTDTTAYCAAGWAIGTTSSMDYTVAVAPFVSSEQYTCQMAVDGRSTYQLPVCLATLCTPIANSVGRLLGADGDGHGNASQATAKAGDQVLISCDPSYGALNGNLLTCLGDSSQTSSHSSWQSDVLGPLSDAQLGALCQRLGVSIITVLPPTSAYARSITFEEYTPTADKPLRASPAGPLQYQVSYQMLFPFISQLSPSNALEAGLMQTPGLTVIANVSSSQARQVSVTFDSNSQVEGVQALVVLEAGQYESGTWLPLATNSIFLQGQCGCYASNSAGQVLKPTVVQSFDLDNSLTLSFLPQSMCARDYKIQQWNDTLGSYGGWSDVPLPILQTSARVRHTPLTLHSGCLSASRATLTSQRLSACLLASCAQLLR